jgi:hypothetical protein
MHEYRFVSGLKEDDRAKAARFTLAVPRNSLLNDMSTKIGID